jgi:hypothetical protein
MNMKAIIGMFVILTALFSTQAQACDADLARKTALRDLKEEYKRHFELGIASEVKIYVSFASPIYRALHDENSKIDQYAVRWFVTVDGRETIGEFKYIANMTLSSGFCSSPLVTMQTIEPEVLNLENTK